MVENRSSKPLVEGSIPSIPVFTINATFLFYSRIFYVRYLFSCSRNTKSIHSILLLIRVFFRGTILLFCLQMEYYARLFLIVYVGAIVVLFLLLLGGSNLKGLILLQA